MGYETKVITIRYGQEFGIWDRLCAPLPLGKRDDRIAITMDNERWSRNLFQRVNRHLSDLLDII